MLLYGAPLKQESYRGILVKNQRRVAVNNSKRVLYHLWEWGTCDSQNHAYRLASPRQVEVIPEEQKTGDTRTMPELVEQVGPGCQRTYALIWLDRKHEKIDFHLTQVLFLCAYLVPTPNPRFCTSKFLCGLPFGQEFSEINLLLLFLTFGTKRRVMSRPLKIWSRRNYLPQFLLQKLVYYKKNLPNDTIA